MFDWPRRVRATLASQPSDRGLDRICGAQVCPSGMLRRISYSGVARRINAGRTGSYCDGRPSGSEEGILMYPRLLRTFLAVARSRNITRAAQQIHLAQSSVSDQIQSLETELGTDLFTRSKLGLELTRAGEALMP